MRYKELALVLLASAVLAGCSRQSSQETGSTSQGMTWTELAARFPGDLGPGTVDVSGYPQGIQENYKFFLAVCSSCHGAARPLNAPISNASDWKRYVHRMHVKLENRGFLLSKEDEKRILKFLVHDSKARKIDRKQEFDAQQEALRTVYRQMEDERNKLIERETRNLPKKETPFVGVK